MKRVWIILVVFLLLVWGGCTSKSQKSEVDGMAENTGYRQISQEEAKEMMIRDDGHVIVDVRREDEYAEGHIPGAILISNESIGSERPEQLPDYDQIILIYCRSGNRSKQAAAKLVALGYTNIYEFGGIIDWTGDVVTEETEVTDDHGGMTPNAFVAVKVGEDIFTIDLEDNSSADAFYEKLKEGNIEIVMHDYGSFEKVGNLPWKLPTNDEEITTEPGDLILYQGDKITVYYDENTWNFTKLGRLNATSEEIKEVFGDKDEIKASFFLEGTE